MKINLKSPATKLLTIFILIVILTTLILISPFLVIWALNTLFLTLDIPYTFSTWAAVLLLYLTLHKPRIK